jgi:hypothetical protein
LGEKSVRGQVFLHFSVPTMSPICSPKKFPTFSLLDVFPQDVPNSTKLYPQFLPKVEISLSWAKGEAPLYFYFKECPMFPKKSNGPIKVAHCHKKKIQKRLCVQPAPSN